LEDYGNYAWLVSFGSGGVYDNPVNYGNDVRCVR